ncbi:MAG: sugar ABC transporter substrate-binding protein [bacterium]|nr:sugar ABC transporter substrate-binding protein [bacterium]
MKKLTKRFIVGLLACAMILSITACGSTGNSTEDKSAAKEESAAKVEEVTAETTTSEETAPTSDEPVTIKITWWGGQARHDYTQQLLDLYTESHPNVSFEAVPAGWDGYFDKLSTQAASGSMPDIMQMDYLYISTYAKNGVVADLNEFAKDGTIDTSEIDETILNTGMIDGKLAGMVLSTSALAIGYNPEVFEKAGLAEPDGSWNWSEFIDTNRKISEVTGKESIIVSSGATGDIIPLRYWLSQHGESLFNEDGTALGYTDDQLVVAFLSMWKDMVDENIYPDPDEEAQILTLGHEGSPVVTGDAATVLDWNNYASRVSSVNDKIKITTPPVSDENGESGLWNKPGMFFSVAETSKVKKECAEFINWFVNSEEANTIIMGERGTPVSASVREAMIQSGNMTDQQVAMFEYADRVNEIAKKTPAPDPEGISEINETIKNIGSSVFYEQATPEEAASTFRKEVSAILARNK